MFCVCGRDMKQIAETPEYIVFECPYCHMEWRGVKKA